MTDKVIALYPNQNIPEALRLIADQIESGQERFANVTMIGEGYGGEMAVFHLGSKNDDYAVKDAVFNMTFGLGYLTSSTFRIE